MVHVSGPSVRPAGISSSLASSSLVTQLRHRCPEQALGKCGSSERVPGEQRKRRLSLLECGVVPDEREGAAEAGVSEMTEVLCICAFLRRQECCQRLLFCPFYRQANRKSGNLRESGRCQGAHQFKPLSDLSAPCVILFPKVESGLWGKSNFMSFAVSKGNAFPPSSQTSAATAFVMCS